MKKACFALAILSATLVSYGVACAQDHKGNGDGRRSNGEHYSERQIPRPAPVKVSTKPSSGATSKDADQSKDGKNNNLELNIRSVKAAESSAYWAMWAVCVGVASTIGLIVTLGFAGYQAHLTRKALFGEHRPRIRLRAARLDELGPEVPLRVNLAMINIGADKTNGIGLSLSLIVTSATGSVIFGPDIVTIEDLLAGQDRAARWTTTFAIPVDEAVGVHMGAREMFLYADISYRDGNKSARRTGVFRKYDRLTGNFERVGTDHPRAHEDFEA
jgi:hypothetical protein